MWLKPRERQPASLDIAIDRLRANATYCMVRGTTRQERGPGDIAALRGAWHLPAAVLRGPVVLPSVVRRFQHVSQWTGTDLSVFPISRVRRNNCPGVHPCLSNRARSTG